MNQDRKHEPNTQPTVPPLWAEPPLAPVSFFAMPTIEPTGSEVVVSQQSPVAHQQPGLLSPQQAGPVAAQRVEQAPGQQGQGLAEQHRAQLQRLCRHLRETDQCPGQCVLSRARQNRRLGRFPGMS